MHRQAVGRLRNGPRLGRARAAIHTAIGRSMDLRARGLGRQSAFGGARARCRWRWRELAGWRQGWACQVAACPRWVGSGYVGCVGAGGPAPGGVGLLGVRACGGLLLGGFGARCANDSLHIDRATGIRPPGRGLHSALVPPNPLAPLGAVPVLCLSRVAKRLEHGACFGWGGNAGCVQRSPAAMAAAILADVGCLATMLRLRTRWPKCTSRALPCCPSGRAT